MSQPKLSTQIAKAILMVIWITSGFALLATLSGNTTLLQAVCLIGGSIALLLLLTGAYLVAQSRQTTAEVADDDIGTV